MRLHRPILAGIALATLLPVSAAEAAAGVSPAGSAQSTATLASVSVGAIDGVLEATTIAIGTITAQAGTTSSAAPSVSFVPVTLNGVKNGAVTVTPANSPKTVGGLSTADLGVLSATSPAATLKAADGASRSSSISTSLGSVKILGLPVKLDGGVNAGSLTDASRAEAGKAISISNVELPSIADLLSALGLDLSALPAATLNALVNDLRLTISGATQTAIDAANNAIDTASQNLGDGQEAVTDAQADLTAKTAAFQSALSGATLPGGVEGPLTVEQWEALDQTVKDAVLTLNTGLAATAAAYETAKTALATAQGAIAGLQAALDAAIAALAGIVNGVLDGVPLVKVGAAEIGTKAAVAKARTAAITGSISGVEVLGTDVLSDVTGDSTVDVAELAGELAGQVNAALNTVTTALSNALSSVTGATGLVIPAPKVELMVKKTATGTDGAFGTASATLSALSISLGSATIPAVYALDGAGSLPGIAAVTGGFKTAPLAMNVGTVTEAARFRPGSATPAKPAKPGDQGTHPATGGPAGLAIVAVIGAALAVGVRRHLRAE